jgi:hypothetical protein
LIATKLDQLAFTADSICFAYLVAIVSFAILLALDFQLVFEHI